MKIKITNNYAIAWDGIKVERFNIGDFLDLEEDKAQHLININKAIEHKMINSEALETKEQAPAIETKEAPKVKRGRKPNKCK